MNRYEIFNRYTVAILKYVETGDEDELVKDSLDIVDDILNNQMENEIQIFVENMFEEYKENK